MRQPLPPVVLVLAGHDPTGGAGLIADSESIAACGGWAVTIPTAFTIQNCHNVVRVVPTDAALMGQMVDEIAMMPVAAIKLGLISSASTLQAAIAIIRRFPGVPVVADPVLKAGGGTELSTPELRQQYRDQLLAHVDILTPNRAELAMLTPECQTTDDDTARAVALLSLGCQAVLVSATDDPLPGTDDQVQLTLHSPDNTRQWQWPRLPEQFHGSGCTLSSAIAARLAVGERLLTACEQAQHYTWQSLSHGYQPASGQCLPNRTPRASRF
ncbi:bifunctional hydroxymethylpyrimidine kinase/phosphomethylpyrimidine kinase [Vreelandella arcis]|uniref:hydroxymethylpyrimidine kinase n=1 Tax=Vreelandella arcis TaxID=416873 RepID=A0A1G9WUQ9_9GAMM|nr:hydroxymethylpyrimidine/phosphomethylpyrimidine kinase [Halomonas arcis]SDM88230.1 hydroxymethylpyrimidine/phosphomethylpyrimidine kinase [Halomonas arcis]